MNTRVLLTTAAVAAAFIAAPAEAATVLYVSGSAITVTPTGVPGTHDADFVFRISNTVPGAANAAFTATFTFDSPFAGLGSAIATNVIVRNNRRSDVDFTGASINGTAGSLSNDGPVSMASIIDAPIVLGSSNTLVLTGRLNPNGNGVGDALVTGSLTLVNSGAPEPAAWGLLILGFGAVGGAMRRRGKTSVAFA